MDAVDKSAIKRNNIKQHLDILFRYNFTDREYAINSLVSILKTIINSSKAEKQQTLPINNLTNQFSKSPICIELLLDAGFIKSRNMLIFNHTKSNLMSLRQIFNQLIPHYTNKKFQKKSKQKNQKKNKLRTSLDIYKRLLWDNTLQFDKENVVIGYNDSQNNTIVETKLLEWIPIDKGGDIPMHHIIYFAIIINYNNNTKIILWDKRIKLDRLFGSGKTKYNETINYVLPLKTNINQLQTNDEPCLLDAFKTTFDSKYDENVILNMYGSFFPIHNNHLFLMKETYKYLLSNERNKKYNVLGGIITLTHSNGLCKKFKGNLNVVEELSKHRIKMCEIATENIKWIVIDSWLCKQKKGNAVLSRKYLKELINNKYEKNKVKIITIIGDDNIYLIKNTIKYQTIICVQNRENKKDIKEFLTLKEIEKYKNNLIIINATNNIPSKNCSSTKIRNIFRIGLNTQNEEYLKENLDLNVLKYHKLNKITYKHFENRNKFYFNKPHLLNEFNVNKNERNKLQKQKNNIELFKSLNMIPITDMNEFELECKNKDIIGYGVQGFIQCILWKKNNFKYAIKKYQMIKNYEKQFKCYKTELKSLLLLSENGGHNNIIKYFNCGYSDQYNFFILELLDMTLMEFINNDFNNKWYKNKCKHNKKKQKIISIPNYWLYAFSKLANGLGYINNLNIMHRDLNISNIMVRLNNYSLDKFELILIDFGCSSLIKNSNKFIRGSTRHYAPESIGINNYIYNSKSETYSFGNLLFEFIHKGKMIYSHIRKTGDVWKCIAKGQTPQFKINCDKQFELLIRSCWQYNSENRPTFYQIEQSLIDMCNCHDIQ